MLVLGGVLVLRFGIWCLGFPAAAGAGAVPEFKGIPLSYKFNVAAIRTKDGEDDVHFFVELQFIRRNAKRFSAPVITLPFMRAFNNFIRYGVRDI